MRGAITRLAPAALCLTLVALAWPSGEAPVQTPPRDDEPDTRTDQEGNWGAKPPNITRESPARAPIVIDGVAADGRANVRITFLADAADVNVTLWGTGGLTLLTPPVPISGAAFARGETVELDPQFQGGSPRSNLAVQVQARIRGRSVVAIVPIPVGSQAAPAKKPANVRLDGAGQRVHVLPARRRN